MGGLDGGVAAYCRVLFLYAYISAFFYPLWYYVKPLCKQNYIKLPIPNIKP